MQTGGWPQEETVWQDPSDPVQAEGGGKVDEVHIYAAEPAYPRMGELLQNRKYESIPR